MLEGLKTLRTAPLAEGHQAALNKLKGNDMKKTQQKTHRITFQEKTPKGFVQKSFDTYKDHVGWHLQQMRKSPDLIRGVSFRSI